MLLAARLCALAFLVNFQPSEPFLTQYLLTSKNLTASVLASDVWPLLVMAAFSLSNGWLTSCALMHAPEAVPPSERGRAGSLMICFLNGGLFVGSALSFAVKSAMCGGCNPFVTPAPAQSHY